MAGMLDLRKIPGLFNQAIRKLRPADFEMYLFPDDILEIIEAL
jgi:hypothetical protein